MISEITSVELSFEGRTAHLFGYADDYFFQNINEHLHGAVTVIAELRRLAPESVIVDVGANIGTSALAASYIVPGASVISFEPSPRALSCLRKTVEANNLSCVEIIPAAVGRRTGAMAMAETEFLAGSHLLPLSKKTRDAQTALVSIVSLDDVLIRQKKLTRVDLIKIDVEGFELDVLDGAMEVIETFKPRMVIEFGAFGVVVNADGSPLQLVERMLEISGGFSVGFPWGEMDVLPTSANIREFIFSNMKVGAQDVAISVKEDFVAPNRRPHNSRSIFERVRGMIDRRGGVISS